MKKIFINKKQERLIKEAMDMKNSLPNNVLKAIETGKADLYGIDEPYLIKLFNNGLESAKMDFNDDITQRKPSEIRRKLNKLLTICAKKESRLKEQLEKLCADIITSIFNIKKSDMQITCLLEEHISNTKQFHIYPDSGKEDDYEYDNLDAIDDYKIAINKRNIINAIVYGAAMKISEDIKKVGIGEIFEMDEELPHLYSKIIKLNNYLLYTENIKITDDHPFQGGYCEVKLGNDIYGTKVEAHGICFPILLTETLRGVFEVIASNGLPDIKMLAMTVIDKTDTLENEVWNQRFGREIWFKYAECLTGVNLQYLPQFFKYLFSLDDKDFIYLFKEITMNTKSGKEHIKNIINKAVDDTDYHDFEKDLANKREENALITDEYFDNDELVDEE